MSYTDYDISPCPFCGASVKTGGRSWLGYDQDHYFSIACTCGALGPKADSKEKAIMAWNKRAFSDRVLLWKPFDFQEDKVDLKGKLKSFDFSSILQMLSSDAKTGILQLSQGQKSSAICMKEGRVIAASSNYGPQLGQILFDKGLVSLERLQEVLKKARKSGRRLGETLLDLDYLKPDTLKGVVRQQISDTVQESMRWQEGEFKFRDCRVDFDERSVENISIMEMMLDALRTSDELAYAQDPEEASFFHDIKII